jgi:hypothetical protein
MVSPHRLRHQRQLQRLPESLVSGWLFAHLTDDGALCEVWSNARLYRPPRPSVCTFTHNVLPHLSPQASCFCGYLIRPVTDRNTLAMTLRDRSGHQVLVYGMMIVKRIWRMAWVAHPDAVRFDFLCFAVGWGNCFSTLIGNGRDRLGIRCEFAYPLEAWILASEETERTRALAQALVERYAIPVRGHLPSLEEITAAVRAPLRQRLPESVRDAVGEAKVTSNVAFDPSFLNAYRAVPCLPNPPGVTWVRVSRREPVERLLLDGVPEHAAQLAFR